MLEIPPVKDALTAVHRVLRGCKNKNRSNDEYFHGLRIHIESSRAPRDCMDLLRAIPNGKVSLVVTSPPYNIGKEYEKKKTVQAYLEWQEKVIKECHRTLADDGSICWQVGNYVDNGSILPLDILLHPIFDRGDEDAESYRVALRARASCRTKRLSRTRYKRYLCAKTTIIANLDRIASLKNIPARSISGKCGSIPVILSAKIPAMFGFFPT